MNLNSMGFSRKSGSNCLVDYKNWRVVNSSGVMKIKDNSRKRNHATLYSGQGFKSNGTNQTITVPINATIQTEIKRINGVIVLNTNPQILTDYVIGSTGGVYTDVFLFTDVLTQAEIELYTNNPNKFFQDTRDGVIDNCVLNMPLHGVNKYQVDYSRFSLLEYPYNNVRTGYTNVNYIAPIVSSSSIVNSKLRISDNSTATNTPRFLLASDPSATTKNILIAGKYYMVEVKIYSVSSIIASPSIYIKYDTDNNLNGGTAIIENLCDLKPHIIMFKSINGGGIGAMLNDSGTSELTSYFDVEYFIVTEISGVNEVTNYTADCVTGAKQLPYGSQEASFFHKSSGVPIRTGLSPFFESTPYWNNYGNTGYISPLAIVPETFEIIIQRPKIIQTGYTKYLCGGNGPGDITVEITNNSDSTGFIRLRRAGISFTLVNWLNTNTMYISMVCDGTSVYIYINGVLVSTGVPQAYTSSFSVKLLAEHNGPSLIDGRYIRDAAVRLFKVHTKALTQTDITKNFNEYTAKGLLANFVLDENGEYMQDEFGNYIMDI